MKFPLESLAEKRYDKNIKIRQGHHLYTLKSKLKRMGIKLVEKLWSMVKELLSLAGNLTAVIVTVVVIFAIARAVFPVDIVGDEEEVVVTLKSGVEATPVYELVGDEIEGTINAYQPIDGMLRDGMEADPYSKVILNPKRNWDIHAEGAVGDPGYIRYGFLAFNQITGLKTGDVLVFPNVNFGQVAPEYISMQMSKTATEGGIIAIYVDGIEEKSLVAIFDITELQVGNGQADFFQVIEKVGRGKEITGIHNVYLQVEQEGISVGEIRFGR